ncbi:hypothetical protein ABT126_39450 [Streptomyces sp. NPDC002012]|uniref:hypothetical protein n=1 Tax=Streptomyces sp. NPDC002012 TaxID=3154532 RepID=UPI00332E7171
MAQRDLYLYRPRRRFSVTRRCPDKEIHDRYSFALPAEVQGGQLRSAAKPEKTTTI